MKRKVSRVIERVLSIVMFVPYALALAFATACKMDGYEDMPTIKEWFTFEPYEEEN